ncbi:MAG: TlpA family protein disulfide reductase [Opitutus sp.]|nr:TlpA family protein disulfide reductase [Opitutus sp.]
MTNLHLPSVCRRLAVSVVALLLAGLPVVSVRAADEAPARKTYDLPAGNADQSLRRFSEQSGLQVIFPSEVVRDIRANAVQGKLSALRGKVVLVDFWATWCIPCRYESPNVRKVYDAYKSRGFEVISVSIDKPEDAAKIPAVVAEDGMTWRHVHDLTREIQKTYYVTAVPAMFLIDQDGKIASTEARGEVLEREVKRLLKL